MRVRQHHFSNKLYPAIAVLIFLLLAGWIPIQTVYAAELEVRIPYEQVWVNDSAENPDSTFEYRLTAAEGMPVPEEAEGGEVILTLTGNTAGDLILHLPVNKPGYYTYNVSPVNSSRSSRYTVDTTDYEVTFMVINGAAGLEVGVSVIQNPQTGRKFDALEYTQTYRYRPPQDDPGDEPSGNTPGITPGGAAQGNVAAQQPAPGNPPGEVIGQDAAPGGEEPATTIDETGPPLVQHGEDYWALLNLILMLLTILVALCDIIFYFVRPGSDREEERKGRVPEDERWQNRFARRGLLRILAVIAAILSVILFFLTEDMRLPREWIDEYTIWMVILFAAALLFALLSHKREKDGDDGASAEQTTG